MSPLSVFSTDGRSYLTRNELDKEIRDEVEAHSGRITLTELASNLDVDFDIIESRVTELITLDAQNKSPCRLISIPSEVVNSSYVRRVAHEILDRLEEHGQTSIGELTVIFNLPTTFLSSIMQEYQSTLFHVHKYGEKYFTDTFLNATKAKIRGYFTGVIRPVTLSSVASKLQVPENLINSIVRLSVFEKEALSLGFNFSVAHTKISDLSIDAQFENLYDQLNPLVPTTLDRKNWLKVKLVDVAHHFHGSQVRQRSILTPKHSAALKNLQSRSDIVILRPDKSSGVVVINKCEYKDKMLSILGDQSKFLQDVSSNINVRKLESRVKSNLLKLLKMN
ncbi:E3 UFM1-protein ligase 1, partial [Schistosoma haematobium]